MVTNQACS